MTSPRAIRLSAARVRSKVRAALAAADDAAPGPSFPIDMESLRSGPRSLVRSLPEWVGRFGILASSEAYVLWCEPRSGRVGTFPSQAILEVPSGRYFVDALDAGSGRWISRESAEGGPLVAGLPSTGSAVLVRIIPVGV